MPLTEATSSEMTTDNSLPIELFSLKYKISMTLYQKGKIRFSNMIFFSKAKHGGTVAQKEKKKASQYRRQLVYTTKSCITRGN